MRAAALHALCLPNPDQKVSSVQAIDKQLDQVDPNQNLSMPEGTSFPDVPTAPSWSAPLR